MRLLGDPPQAVARKVLVRPRCSFGNGLDRSRVNGSPSPEEAKQGVASVRIANQLLSFVLLVGAACSNPPHPSSPPPPLEVGQLAVSIGNQSLRPGANELELAVVTYDGSLTPPPVTAPLRRVDVAVYLHGLEADADATAEAKFLANGPELDLGGGKSVRANYRAKLDLKSPGAGVIEFTLDRDGSPHRILAPIRVE